MGEATGVSRGLLLTLFVALAACGGGADEVVAIHLSDSAAEGGFDEGLPGDESAGDTAADSETGEGWALPKHDPGGNFSCDPPDDSSLYSACEQKSDCDETDSCFSWEGGGSICSNHCHVDADCPGLDGCGAAPSCVRNVCALRCAKKGECPEGMSCGLLPAVGLRLCM